MSQISEYFPAVGFVESEKAVDSLFTLEAGSRSQTRCPRCGDLLWRTLTLLPEANPQLLQLIGRRLDLLFCWSCPAAVSLTYKPLSNGIEFLDYWKGDGEYPPYEPYPEDSTTVNVSFREQSSSEALIHAEYWSRTSYGQIVQRCKSMGIDSESVLNTGFCIGGIPFLHEFPDVGTCPLCERKYTFLATVPDGNGTELGYSGGECVVMFFEICSFCGVVHAGHQTD